jgi:hypothetical protein
LPLNEDGVATGRWLIGSDDLWHGSGDAGAREFRSEGTKATESLGIVVGCLGVFYRARRGTEAAGKAVEWMA